MAKTFLTIQTELAWRWHNKAFSSLKSGQQTSFKYSINAAKDYIMGWPQAAMGTGWPFSKTTAYIATTAKHTTGTISLTQYSTAVGAGDTAPVFGTTGMADRVLIVSSGTEPYRIATHTDTNNLILATPYLGTTDTDASYSIVKDIYVLPSDFNGFVRKSFIVDGEVDPLIFVRDDTFNLDFNRSVGIGVPDYYGFADTIATGTSKGIKQIWLREDYPETVMGIPYKYYKKVDDLSANGDVSLIGYAEAGDNALFEASSWQIKLSDRESWSDTEIAEAKADANEAIQIMWDNEKMQTADAPEQETWGPVYDDTFPRT